MRCRASDSKELIFCFVKHLSSFLAIANYYIRILSGFHKSSAIILSHKTQPGTTELTQLLDRYGSIAGVNNETVIVAADNIGMPFYSFV